RIPFPAHARGFFYYHSGHQSTPLEGDIRFRVTPDDSPSSFDSGEDLPGPSGFPWTILLPQVACRRGFAWISDQLVHEKLVKRWQLWRCREVFTPGVRTIYPEYTLFHLDSTFLVNFSGGLNLTVIGNVPYRLALNIFAVQTPRYYFPWTGSALARFEASTHPQHAGRRVLHMRIVKIVEPVACTVDAASYGGRILRPEEGELVTACFRGGPPAPWTHDIDDPQPNSPLSTALRALWDISRPP
ncbi:hypothetical protein FB451DRAFT_1046772, partial [Mycena latifolia]